MCRGCECRGECCVSMLKYFMHAKEVKYKILHFTFYILFELICNIVKESST